MRIPVCWTGLVPTQNDTLMPSFQRRKYIPPNFAELRHVVNIAQASTLLRWLDALPVYLPACLPACHRIYHSARYHTLLIWYTS